MKVYIPASALLKCNRSNGKYFYEYIDLDAKTKGEIQSLAAENDEDISVFIMVKHLKYDHKNATGMSAQLTTPDFEITSSVYSNSLVVEHKNLFFQQCEIAEHARNQLQIMLSDSVDSKSSSSRKILFGGFYCKGDPLSKTGRRLPHCVFFNTSLNQNKTENSVLLVDKHDSYEEHFYTETLLKIHTLFKTKPKRLHIIGRHHDEPLAHPQEETITSHLNG